MSTLAGLFRPGGAPYRTVPDMIDLLPKGLQHAATVVYKCIMRFIRDGKLDERATDKAISEDTGWSESFVQKGLHALHIDLAEVKGGEPLIDRERAHGRRTIIPKPLAGKGTPLVATSSPPTPPKEIQETATTGRPSSLSIGSAPKEGEGSKPPAPPELIARACELIPEATPDWVATMVAVYGSEWFGDALDRVEERNRKPHAKPVRRRKFVMDILEAWKVEGGPPRKIEASMAPEPRRPNRAAEKPPAQRLTADDFAEMVSSCQSGPPALMKLARVRLRMALTDGSIAPEQAATIPPELLEPEPPKRE